MSLGGVLTVFNACSLVPELKLVLQSCMCVFDLCVSTVFELVVCEFGGGAHCF